MSDDPLLARMRADGLINSEGSYLVLLSGGRDSVCLLHACVALAGPGAVAALHVNYGLRDGADGDQRHCTALCERVAVELHVHRPTAPPPTGNLQAWARSQRYRAAARIADGAIVAGHTRDDQTETILQRLISSPTRRAVLGMRPREGALLRPLLAISRAETTAYCERHGLSWREDASNATGAYARNRIRREVLPLLRELHPGVEGNLRLLAVRLREEGEVLDDLVDQTLAGEPTITLARLRALPPALARLVVQRLADGALGAIAPGAGSHADTVARLSEQGTARLDLGCGVRAVSEYGVLRVEPLAPPPRPPTPVTLPIPGAVRFGAELVRCELTAPNRAPGVLDRDALADALVVRAWRPGDRMRPLGLGGSKRLQDLFTARRVPQARRATLAVVQSGEEIVWVDGVALAERAKITAETRAAVRLSVERA